MSQKTTKIRPPASTAGKVAAALFLVVAAFYVTLVAGAPFGEAALGGANPGVLPDELRVSSAISVLIYLLLAAVAGTRWAGATLRRRLLHGMTVLMVIGTMMNIASPSMIERILWVPVTVALVVSLWRAARHESLSRASQLQVRASQPA